MAASCLFLAGKVEETPKLSKDIVRTAKNLLSKEQFTAFALNPVDEMLLYEKILLQVESSTWSMLRLLYLQARNLAFGRFSRSRVEERPSPIGSITPHHHFILLWPTFISWPTSFKNAAHIFTIPSHLNIQPPPFPRYNYSSPSSSTVAKRMILHTRDTGVKHLYFTCPGITHYSG